MSYKPSVLVFTTQHMPTGGIESHLREFCRHLSESGVDIDLVVLNSAMLPATEMYFKSICRKVYLGGKGRSSLRLVWLLTTSIKWFFKKYDAVYTNGQGNSLELFSKLVPFSKVWVHHHHTAGDVADQATWTNGYKKAMMKADAVIACSAKNALDMGKALNREVKTIPCFSREIKAQAPTKNGRLKFGYYGRLIREKGIDTLCRLSEENDLDKVEFHIWGEGPAYPSSFFTKYPKVIYHGQFAGEQELAEVIGELDAYLLLSTHPEGLPIALLEVMSAGLPWIATNRGGISDIACDPSTTRVIAADADFNGMKKAVRELADDLQGGKLDRDFQKQLYASKYSSRVLIKRWRQEFGLDAIHD